MKNINLIIDFDSTFVKVETLDVLSKISLRNNPNKKHIINEITSITDDAMNGRITFDIALSKRIKMLQAKKSDIDNVISLIQGSISTSFIKNKEFFIKNSKNCYIVSGGFKEIIFPVVNSYGFKNENIFANTFEIEKNNIIDVNQTNPLVKDKGKVEILKQHINTNNKDSIILGDGYTDYELKKYQTAKYFIQFIENINRKSLNNKADLIANNFDNVIEFINKVNNE